MNIVLKAKKEQNNQKTEKGVRGNTTWLQEDYKISFPFSTDKIAKCVNQKAQPGREREAL